MGKVLKKMPQYLLSGKSRIIELNVQKVAVPLWKQQIVERDLKKEDIYLGMILWKNILC